MVLSLKVIRGHEMWIRLGTVWQEYSLPEEMAVEVIGKSADSVAMEIPGYWRYHYYGTTGKWSNRCGISLPAELCVLRMAELEKCSS